MRIARRIEWVVGIACGLATIAVTLWLATRDVPEPPGAPFPAFPVAAAPDPVEPRVAASMFGDTVVAWSRSAGPDGVTVALRPAYSPFLPAIDVPVRHRARDVAVASGRTDVMAVGWRDTASAARGRAGLMSVQIGAAPRVIDDLADGNRVVAGPIPFVTAENAVVGAWTERDAEAWRVRLATVAPPGGETLAEPVRETVAEGGGAVPDLGGMVSDSGFSAVALGRGGRAEVLSRVDGEGWRLHPMPDASRPALAMARSGTLTAAAATTYGSGVVVAYGGAGTELRPFEIPARSGRTVTGRPAVAVDPDGNGVVVWVERGRGDAVRAVLVRGDGPALDTDVVASAGPIELRGMSSDLQGGLVVLVAREGRAVLLRRAALRRDGRLSPPPEWSTTDGVSLASAREPRTAALAAGGAALVWWQPGTVVARMFEGVRYPR